jgi:hypothetical protein
MHLCILHHSLVLSVLVMFHGYGYEHNRKQCQAGSLTGAVHLSKGNVGVLRLAQRGQKPLVEQKGKSWLDLVVQYAKRLRKQGLSILLLSVYIRSRALLQEVSEKLPQG